MSGRVLHAGGRRRVFLRAVGAWGAWGAAGTLSPLLAHAVSAADRPGALVSARGGGQRASAQDCAVKDWPAWVRFKSRFMSADGRVIDASMADQRTVSEGQSYGLFFALAANDRVAFERLLNWTESNLAQGDLIAHLPAWLWGKKADGQWGVIDSNPAADADMWIAYALTEAGRLWGVRRYTALGALMARRIVREETDFIPGLGRTLLPAPKGFHPSDDVWRLNPSYVPMQLVRRLAGRFPDSGWPSLIDSSLRQIIGPSPNGFAPEWTLYRAGHGFQLDPETQAEGSYNAIRVYLWAGMLAPGSADAKALAHRFNGMVRYIAQHGAPPERVDVRDGSAHQEGNSGFSASVVPLLMQLGEASLAEAQVARVRKLDAQSEPGYYSTVLQLFGLGWQEGRFSFAADGALQLPWEAACATR